VHETAVKGPGARVGVLRQRAATLAQLHEAVMAACDANDA
jgi:hypothetical protein